MNIFLFFLFFTASFCFQKTKLSQTAIYCDCMKDSYNLTLSSEEVSFLCSSSSSSSSSFFLLNSCNNGSTEMIGHFSVLITWKERSLSSSSQLIQGINWSCEEDLTQQFSICSFSFPHKLEPSQCLPPININSTFQCDGTSSTSTLSFSSTAFYYNTISSNTVNTSFTCNYHSCSTCNVGLYNTTHPLLNTTPPTIFNIMSNKIYIDYYVTLNYSQSISYDNLLVNSDATINGGVPQNNQVPIQNTLYLQESLSQFENCTCDTYINASTSFLQDVLIYPGVTCFFSNNIIAGNIINIQFLNNLQFVGSSSSIFILKVLNDNLLTINIGFNGLIIKSFDVQPCNIYWIFENKQVSILVFFFNNPILSFYGSIISNINIFMSGIRFLPFPYYGSIMTPYFELYCFLNIYDCVCNQNTPTTIVPTTIVPTTSVPTTLVPTTLSPTVLPTVSPSPPVLSCPSFCSSSQVNITTLEIGEEYYFGLFAFDPVIIASTPCQLYYDNKVIAQYNIITAADDYIISYCGGEIFSFGPTQYCKFNVTRTTTNVSTICCLSTSSSLAENDYINFKIYNYTDHSILVNKQSYFVCPSVPTTLTPIDTTIVSTTLVPTTLVPTLPPVFHDCYSCNIGLYNTTHFNSSVIFNIISDNILISSSNVFFYYSQSISYNTFTSTSPSVIITGNQSQYNQVPIQNINYINESVSQYSQCQCDVTYNNITFDNNIIIYPGVTCFSYSSLSVINFNNNITFDALGNSSSSFVILIERVSYFNFQSLFVLTNNAQPCNINWMVMSSTSSFIYFNFFYYNNNINFYGSIVSLINYIYIVNLNNLNIYGYLISKNINFASSDYNIKIYSCECNNNKTNVPSTILTPTTIDTTIVPTTQDTTTQDTTVSQSTTLLPTLSVSPTTLSSVSPTLSPVFTPLIDMRITSCVPSSSLISFQLNITNTSPVDVLSVVSFNTQFHDITNVVLTFATPGWECLFVSSLLNCTTSSIYVTPLSFQISDFSFTCNLSTFASTNSVVVGEFSSPIQSNEVTLNNYLDVCLQPPPFYYEVQVYAVRSAASLIQLSTSQLSLSYDYGLLIVDTTLTNIGSFDSPPSLYTCSLSSLSSANFSINSFYCNENSSSCCIDSPFPCDYWNCNSTSLSCIVGGIIPPQSSLSPLSVVINYTCSSSTCNISSLISCFSSVSSQLPNSSSSSTSFYVPSSSLISPSTPPFFISSPFPSPSPSPSPPPPLISLRVTKNDDVIILLINILILFIILFTFASFFFCMNIAEKKQKLF